MLFMTCGPLVLILSDRELELEWKIPRKEGKQTNKQARPQGKRLGH